MPGSIVPAILALVAAYLIGGIPFGYLVVKWTTGADVRASGSGNIGATNVLRTTGRAAGLVTLDDLRPSAFQGYLPAVGRVEQGRVI